MNNGCQLWYCSNRDGVGQNEELEPSAYSTDSKIFKRLQGSVSLLSEAERTPKIAVKHSFTCRSLSFTLASYSAAPIPVQANLQIY